MAIVDQKRIINCPDVRQLFPYKYQWAKGFYDTSYNNLWRETDIGLGEDMPVYRALSDAERHAYVTTFSVLSTSDIIVPDIASSTIRQVLRCPEIAKVVDLFIMVEGIHNAAYAHHIETLLVGESPDSIYQRFRQVDAIRPKFDFIDSWREWLTSGTDTNRGIEDFVIGYFAVTQILEGFFFLMGFNTIFALARNGKMVRSAEQLQYIRRDEDQHHKFGQAVILTIKEEHPDLDWDRIYKEVKTLCNKALAVESDYMDYALPQPILGYSSGEHMAACRYQLQNSLRDCTFPVDLIDAPVDNPVPWLDEMAITKKEKNFFETRVIEYQTGATLDFGNSVPSIDDILAWGDKK